MGITSVNTPFSRVLGFKRLWCTTRDNCLSILMQENKCFIGLNSHVWSTQDFTPSQKGWCCPKGLVVQC
jgi:hypothetical protein